MTEKTLTIALAGNPNSGKTTVFNSLTGARQHVGNWPGVTVEKKEGQVSIPGYDIKVVDLPGVYSLTAYSLDEVIARNFVVDGHSDVVVAIVDASNLERNLYLVVQLLEMEARLVVALNMMDVARSRGYRIDVPELSRLLGVPVVPMVATQSQGVRELLDTVVGVAKGRVQPTGLRLNYGCDMEEEITRLERIIALSSAFPGYSPRWLAVKLLEDDREIIKRFSEQEYDKKEDILKAQERSLAHLRSIYGDEAETIIADARYGFISGLLKDVLEKPVFESPALSDKVDRVVLNRWLGIPVFAAVLFGLFQLVFTLSLPFMRWISSSFGWLGGLTSDISPDWLGALLAEGVIGGVGLVLSFAPVIFLLYLGLSLLEDSGYLARAAFVMDRLMHRIGLHGRSFIPLVLGFGCNVPAVMATRTIENPRDRLVTILVTPLMSCGGRLPIYVLLAGAFFTAYQGLVVFSIYAIGMTMSILLAWLFRRGLVRGESGHFVMELPSYRLPTLTGVITHTWERGRSFLVRAGTVIFSAAVLVWLLDYVGALEPIGRAIAPVLGPAGFGQWQAAVTLMLGVLAKEAVVGTLGTLLAVDQTTLGQTIASQLGWTPLVAFAFMTMCLLYVPCTATIAVIRRETSSWRWTGFVIGYTLALGWLAATLIYQIGRVFF